MRNPALVVALLFSVILLGLVSREYPWLFPQMLGKYPGDALWSMALYLALAVIWPKISSRRLMVFSLAISYGIELSQLYQASWINQIRENTLAHLFLGSTFNSPDFAAYTLGVIIIFTLDNMVKKSIP